MKCLPESYCSPELFEAGAGTVLVVRYKGTDRVEIGDFYVDTFCRGVIAGSFLELTDEEFRGELLSDFFGDDVPEPKSGAFGRKLIGSAVEYAGNLGLAPGEGYNTAARVFGGIDANECEVQFEFGREGKPFYIQDPSDSPETVERILSVLQARCGEDGFGYELCLEGEADESDSDEDFDDLDEDEFEENGGGVVVFLEDSQELGESPSSEQLEFIAAFRSAHEEIESVEVVSGGADSIAGSLLATSLETLESHAEPVTSENLEAAVSLSVMFWNLSALPPELRAKAISELPEEMRGMFRPDEFPEEPAPFLIVDWRVLGAPDAAGALERPRVLLIMAEPTEA